MRKILLFSSACILLQGVVSAGAQHTSHPNPSAQQAAPEFQAPLGMFNVRSYGAFRLFMQKQDYTSKTDLAVIPSTKATEGVGALSGLRGEITLIDGKTIVSYGGGCKACPPPHDEKAALLGTAAVRQWREPVLLSDNLSGKALDDFIIQQAKMEGIDTTKPFPVRLSGKLLNVEMHVIEAPNDGFTGHGSKVHMAKQDEFKHVEIKGMIVGFYVPNDMFGTLTHPGEHFHFHWVDEARTRTTHLDAFGLEKGSSLLLPKE